MRFDFVTIFPEYFAPLELSLMGKAQTAGLIQVGVHDLRDWTTDKHRTVDDTPYGGGAGMVMRPDVWGRALDDILEVPSAQKTMSAEATAPSDVTAPTAEPAAQAQAQRSPRQILAIPTPSGRPLTQRMAEDLAAADHIVVACGRYEGIDQRVADHYAGAGVEVLPFSIGDYVLNGGEVAALVLAEAVGRLVDGVVGNPQSLVEESHSDAGLLEYPAYTRPETWRDQDVPSILKGGDHAAIDRWRRDRSLERTARTRPDLLDRLDPTALNTQDVEVLAAAGHIIRPRRATLTIGQAARPQAGQIADLAARTFPDACPPHLGADAIAEFIATNLTEHAFDALLADPERNRILVASIDGEIVGYTLTFVGPEALPKDLIRPGKINADAAYLSKCYVDANWRGSGIAGALLEAAVADAATKGAAQVALGTNIGNKRASAFYKRHGFKVVGRRHFDVGGVDNLDNLFVRNITA